MSWLGIGITARRDCVRQAIQTQMRQQHERILALRDSAMAFIPGSFETTREAAPKSVRWLVGLSPGLISLYRRTRDALNDAGEANQKEDEEPPRSEKRPRKRVSDAPRPPSFTHHLRHTTPNPLSRASPLCSISAAMTSRCAEWSTFPLSSHCAVVVPSLHQRPPHGAAGQRLD